MTQNTLSSIASAETYSQKIHLGWKYCQDSGVQYNAIDSFCKHPAAAAEMIWAHGKYGPRKSALKKLDAMDIVCQFLSLRGGIAA